MGHFARAAVGTAAVLAFVSAAVILAAIAAPEAVAMTHVMADSPDAAAAQLESFRPLAGVLWAAAGALGLVFAVSSLPQWRVRS